MSVPHPFHEFPKHLYAAGPITDGKGVEHPSAVHVSNAGEEKFYRDLGYNDGYVPQTYPLALHKKIAGQVVSVTAVNEAEVQEFKRKGWVTADKV